MKKHIYLPIILLAAASVASSCSTLHIFPAKDASASTSPATTGKSGGGKTISVPTDREAIVKRKDVNTYTPEELAEGAVKGDWAIETVNGIKTVGLTMPFLKFDPASKMVYGNNGCNTLNAQYTYNPKDSSLVFSNIITTMRACDSETGITDIEINMALNQTRHYSWTHNDTQYFMTFLDAGGHPLLTVMHQNFQFLNGTWLVESIKGTLINTSEKMLCPDMKLVIDIDENKIHGNTGCNIINGIIDTDMEAPNSISFRNIGMTRMACSGPNYENDLVIALEEVASACPTSKNEVDLVDDSGNVVLRLVRTSDK